MCGYVACVPVALKTEAARSSETPKTIYQPTRRYVLKNLDRL
jgi:hypothetical protein